MRPLQSLTVRQGSGGLLREVSFLESCHVAVLLVQVLNFDIGCTTDTVCGLYHRYTVVLAQQIMVNDLFCVLMGLCRDSSNDAGQQQFSTLMLIVPDRDR